MTRPLAFAFSAAALAATAVTPALADDLFTLVGDGGTTITFTEPGTPNIPDTNALQHYFYFQGTDSPNDRVNLPYTVNGQTTYTDEIDFFDTTYGGGLAIDDGYVDHNFVELSGPQLFSGTTSNPTFLLGTFQLTSFFPVCDPDFPSSSCVDNNENYTLTISDNSVTATPEPASLTLLGTGLLGGFAAVRRRLRA